MPGDLGIQLYLPHWWWNFEETVFLVNIWVLKFLSCVKDVGEDALWGLEENLKRWTSVSTLKQELSFFIASYTRLSVPQTSRDSPVSASYLAIKGIADTCCCTGCVWSGERNSSLHALPTEPALTFDFKITSDSTGTYRNTTWKCCGGITKQSGNIDDLPVK